MRSSSTIILVLPFIFTLVRCQSGFGDYSQTWDIADKYLPRERCYLDGQGKCETGNKSRSLLDEWINEDCHKCICFEAFGIYCCNLLQLPVDWPEDCFPKIDRIACKVDMRSLRKPYLSCANKRLGGLKKISRKMAVEKRRHILIND